MIAGIGIDLCEISRIKKAVTRNQNFITKVLTHNEVDKFNELTGKRQWEFLAGRFAAKEAFSKAVGSGLGKIALHDVEVLNNEDGAPIITQNPTDKKAFISISHTAETATAIVILERNK